MKSFKLNEIKVFYQVPYSHSVNLPGGIGFARMYEEVLTEQVDTLYEFCSGPGFIGFYFLSKGMCENLILSDINPLAIECILRTIEYNDLGDKVEVWMSDGFKHIPYNVQADLIISNPPHHKKIYDGCRELLHVDSNWNLHQNYYENLHRFLSYGGKSIWIENSANGKPDGRYEGEGSTKDDFIPMIEKNKNIEYVSSKNCSFDEKYYFLETRRLK